MKSKTVMGIAALALGIACAAAPAVAKNRKVVVIHPAASYSNTGPWSAPLSPGGIAAAGDAFGGPGFNGPIGGGTAGTGAGLYAYAPNTLKYSNTGPSGAPLSPGGISAAADAFGGPGYLR